MSGKVEDPNFQPIATSQGWFSWESWRHWFADIFAAIGGAFFGKPKMPEDVTPLPETVNFESIKGYIETNFTPQCTLAEKQILKGAIEEAKKTIAILKKMEELIRPIIPVKKNCYDWTPINTELAKAKTLTTLLVTKSPNPYPRVHDAPLNMDMRIFPSTALDNTGNNCFINVLLQTIFAIPELVDPIVFAKGQNPLIQQAYQEFNALQRNGELTKTPNLAPNFRTLNEDFKGWRQHDPTEMFQAILEPLEAKDNPLFVEEVETTYYQDYETYKDQIDPKKHMMNPQGGAIAKAYTIPLIIELDEKDSSLAIEAFLQKRGVEEGMDNGPVDFTLTNGKKVALSPQRKTIQVSKPPPYLFMQLKRFIPQGEGANFVYKKNRTKIDFKKHFYLDPKHDVSGKGGKYEWVAIINHEGLDPDYGHYVMYRKTEEGYYYYSDSSQRKVTEEEFLKAGQDLYFGYARKVDCEEDIAQKVQDNIFSGETHEVNEKINECRRSETKLLTLFNEYLDQEKPCLHKLQKVYDALPLSFHRFAAQALKKEQALVRNDLIELKTVTRPLLVKREEDTLSTHIVAQYETVRKQNQVLAQDHVKQIEHAEKEKAILEHLQSLGEEDRAFAASLLQKGLDKLLRHKNLETLLKENEQWQAALKVRTENAEIIKSLPKN